MEKKKKREKGEIKTKNRKKGGRNAVKRVARRVEQCVINVKREPRANRVSSEFRYYELVPLGLWPFFFFLESRLNRKLFYDLPSSTPESSSPKRAILKIDVSWKWWRAGFLHLCPLIDHLDLPFLCIPTIHLRGKALTLWKCSRKFYFFPFFPLVLFVNVFTYLFSMSHHREFRL